MYSRRAVLLLTTFIASFMTAAAHSATLTKGTFELEPSAQFSHQSFSVSGSGAGSITNLSLLGTLGYFATPQFELIGSPVVTHQSFDDPVLGTTSGTSFGLLAGLRYNFEVAGNIVPFLEGSVGLQKFSGDLGGSQTSFVAPQIGAGIRVMVGGAASVNFAALYEHVTSAEGVKDLSSNDFALLVGVSVFPGHGK
jgi:hypothetical protein